MCSCRCPFLVVQDFKDHHDSLPAREHNFYLEFCSLCWQSHSPPCRPRPPRPTCTLYHVRTWTSSQGGTNPQKSPPKSLDSDENICYFVVNSRFCRFVGPHMQSFCPACKSVLLGVGLTDTWTRAKCETKYTVGGRFQSNLTKSSESDSSRKLCIT